MDNDGRERRLSFGNIWAFFYPLTLSWLMMFASQPIIQAGLARMESAELVLAAFAVAFNMATLMESPTFMVTATVNALVCDMVSYRRIVKWVMALSAALSVNALLVACFDPLYEFVFGIILGTPPEIASAARPGFTILATWPTIVAYRLLHQGLLMKFGLTRTVTWGTIGRLIAIVTVLPVLVKLFPRHGVIVGASVLLFGVIVDGIIAVWAAKRLLGRGALPECDETAAQPPSYDAREFCRFYFPLAVTSTLRQVCQPLMLGGIARSYQASLALAAWPVALAFTNLFSGPIMMTRQVVVALVNDHQSHDAVRRFCLNVTAATLALLLVIAFTPLADWYFRQAIGLEGPVLDMTIVALRWCVAMPALTAVQGYYQGVLILAGRTFSVNTASIINLAIAVAAVYLLAGLTRIPGHVLASASLTLGLVVENVLLHQSSRGLVGWLLSRSVSAKKP